MGAQGTRSSYILNPFWLEVGWGHRHWEAAAFELREEASWGGLQRIPEQGQTLAALLCHSGQFQQIVENQPKWFAA